MGKVIVRFLISIPSALIFASVLNYFNHKAYYTTIRNTQTVDFNILANTLPTKLSQALQKGNLEEIQRTVNSNYGLFGIIVTNCKREERECNNQQVIAKSQPAREGWGGKQFPENLLRSPYDILRSPAPITAEWGFKDARSVEVIPTGRINKGKVIGRVYYVRRDPPEFVQTQISWLLTPVESLQILTATGNTEKAGKKLYEFIDSGSNKYFFLTNLLGLVVGLFAWRIWERILYQRKLQQKLHEQREKKLAAVNDRYRKEALAFQKKVQNLEISLLNKKKDEEYLQAELGKAREILNQEKQKVQDLHNKFAEAVKESELAKEENHLLNQQLNSAREQASEKWQAVFSLQQQLNSLKQSDTNVVEFQDRLKQAIQEAASSQKIAECLTRELEASSEVLRNKESNYSDLVRQFSEAQETLKIREDNILDLQKNLAEMPFREKQYLELIESFKQAEARLEAEKKQLENSWKEDRQRYSKTIESFISKQLDDLCDSLGQEIEELKEKLDAAEKSNLELEQENESLQEILNQLDKCEINESSYPDGNIEFSTVFDALKAAEGSCSILEIWNSAEESVHTLNHYLPNKVHQNLLILSDVGKLYFEKSVGADLDDIFRNKGAIYSPRESLSTMSHYGRYRIFRHRGNTKQMTRHLKVGRRLRIYFEFDEQSRKVQIGYCGKHLPTARG
jgi:hypothetical protein